MKTHLPVQDETSSFDTEQSDQKVTIKEQYAVPPACPQVLVLTDEVMETFQRPDRYMHCYAMAGHDLKAYTDDVAN